MAWQGWTSLAIALCALLLLTTTHVGPHLVMMAALTLLVLTGILTSSEALAGFANAGLVTVAAMFVVSAGLHASGGVDLLVDSLLGRPRTSRGALSRMFLPVGLLSAFLNNTPVVATMIPALHAWSRRIQVPASKLMIPLSYCAILGGTTTMIGTSTNLVVNGQYRALTGEPGFSLFSISAAGIPVAVGGLLFMWLFFPRILPDRSEQQPFENIREFTLEVMVTPGGPLVGKSVVEAGLRHLVRIYLVEIVRGSTIVTAASSEERLQGGDRLVFAGDTEAISDLLRINGIGPSDAGGEMALARDRAERRLVEVVVSPRCGAVGSAIRDARFRDRYGAVVLAVARHGERVAGNLGTIKLEAGDTLLLEARPAFVKRQRYSRDFLVINDLDTVTPNHERAYTAWAILGGAVLAAGSGVVDMLEASLSAAGLMILTRCCSASQAEKSLDLTVLTTIAASFALGAALQKTGVAASLAGGIVQLSDGSPLLLLILTYAAISLMTEVVTNNAAALIMLPIVLQITDRAGLNDVPYVVAIMFAASASFATPLGYQTNLMVYGPGRYRFNDFLRAGIPMNIVVGALSIAAIAAIWPLSA
jgi:di/tricarboxylate transporter